MPPVIKHNVHKETLQYNTIDSSHAHRAISRWRGVFVLEEALVSSSLLCRANTRFLRTRNYPHGTHGATDQQCHHHCHERCLVSNTSHIFPRSTSCSRQSVYIISYHIIGDVHSPPPVACGQHICSYSPLRSSSKARDIFSTIQGAQLLGAYTTKHGRSHGGKADINVIAGWMIACGDAAGSILSVLF